MIDFWHETGHKRASRGKELNSDRRRSGPSRPDDALSGREHASERGLMHWKIGNYGETILPKPAKNSLAQAPSYIRPVKAYLSATCDRRFANVDMEAVEAFANCGYYGNSQPGQRTDLDGGAAGVFASRRNEHFAEHPSAWLLRACATYHGWT
jgi:hypothetical protein